MSGRFSLGRADAGKADILLPGATISAMHAELLIEKNGAALLRDLSSSNGTAIRRAGKRLKVSSTPLSLSAGDVLLFGSHEFGIDEILSKIAAGNARASMPPKRVSDAPLAGYRKMVRCPSCGSVTPAGRPCVECGYRG